VNPNLLRVITRGRMSIEALGGSGPLVDAFDEAKSLPGPNALLRLADGVAIKESVALQTSTAKGVQPFGADAPDPSAALYWKDPLRNGSAVPPLYASPRPCHRFYFTTGQQTQVRFDEDIHRGHALFERLRRSPTCHKELRDSLDPGPRALLERLLVAKMAVAAT